MLVRVDNFVINTDQITHIQINEFGNSIRVYFTSEVSVPLDFPKEGDQQRFLEKIGLKDYFA